MVLTPGMEVRYVGIRKNVNVGRIQWMAGESGVMWYVWLVELMSKRIQFDDSVGGW